MSSRSKKLTKPNQTTPEAESPTTPPPSSEPGPTVDDLDRAAELNRLRSSITKSIVLIAEQCNSKLSSILLAYVKCASPSRAVQGDADFPRSLKQHPRNRDRSSDVMFGDLLCFHVGNAIAAYHQAIRGENPEHLRARVVLLEEIAQYGPGQFVPYGGDVHGWTLMHREAVPKERPSDDV